MDGDQGRRPGRREEILAAALRLFSEHGVEAVTTRQIAAEVGISQPSLYAHFATKQDLLGEVCARAFQQLSARLSAISEGPADASGGGSRLEAGARAYIQFALERPDAYRVAFMLQDPAPARASQDHMGLAAGLQAFALHHQIVVEELGEGRSPEEITIISQSLWASLHGLASLLIARPTFPWADQTRLIDHHVLSVVGASRRLR